MRSYIKAYSAVNSEGAKEERRPSWAQNLVKLNYQYFQGQIRSLTRAYQQLPDLRSIIRQRESHNSRVDLRSPTQNPSTRKTSSIHRCLPQLLISHYCEEWKGRPTKRPETLSSLTPSRLIRQKTSIFTSDQRSMTTSIRLTRSWSKKRERPKLLRRTTIVMTSDIKI